MTNYRHNIKVPLILGLLVALLLVPAIASGHIMNLLILILITIVAVHGVNIVLGFCGEITVAQAAFVGVSAYCFAILSEAGCPWIVSMILGVAVTCLIGLLFGLPALRVKGFYLLMVTLGAQFILPWVFSHWKSVTGGLVWGQPVPEITILGGTINSDLEKYYVALVVCSIMTVVVWNIKALTAIRDNDLAAEAMGINVFKYKLIAFFLCALFAGVAGFLWAIYTEHLFPDHFYLMDSVWYIAMLIVGGMGTISGAILGTAFLLVLSELTVSYAPVFTDLLPFEFSAASGVSLGSLMFSVIIMLFLIFEPRGITHAVSLISQKLEGYKS
jgi:branched-chain amino acid transport system permease protein